MAYKQLVYDNCRHDWRNLCCLDLCKIQRRWLMAAPAVLAAALGALQWLNSLPSEIKYILFLAGLAGDTAIVGSTFGGGIVGSVLSFLINSAFGLSLEISSFQLLIVFTLLPICWWLLNH